jgi:hypothetical protein
MKRKKAAAPWPLPLLLKIVSPWLEANLRARQQGDGRQLRDIQKRRSSDAYSCSRCCLHAVALLNRAWEGTTKTVSPVESGEEEELNILQLWWSVFRIQVPLGMCATA